MSSFAQLQLVSPVYGPKFKWPEFVDARGGGVGVESAFALTAVVGFKDAAAEGEVIDVSQLAKSRAEG
jgi:hypothetical protein